MTLAQIVPMQIDWDTASRFLSGLFDTDNITWQTFDDNKTRKNELLAKHLHGAPTQVAAHIQNLQRAGAGVFFMVNEGDGKGRGAENVTGVRCYFVDGDDAPLENGRRLPLSPTAVVQTSSNRYSWFYRIVDAPLDKKNFKRTQEALAELFGSDPEVSDLPRVMRVPGTWHQKGAPFQSRCIFLGPANEYTEAEFQAALAAALGRQKPARPNLNNAVMDGIDPPMERPIGIKEGERDVRITSWAGHCIATGMTYDQTLADCLAANQSFDPPLDDDQVRKCVDSIWRKDSAAKAAADSPNSMESPAAEAALKADPAAATQSPDAWKVRAMRDRHGNMIPNVTNVLLALEHVFPKRFTYDQFACAVKIDRERPIEDADVIELQSWLQKQGIKRVGKDCVHDALQARARLNAYHPLREEIQGTEWDGVPRVDKFATDYLGCEPTPYNFGIVRMLLISMVARVFDPGCQCDHMVILEGAQGILKSSALRALAGEKYFSDQLPDLSHKDSSQHLRDKWLLEISEMHTFDRATTNQLKAYITRRVERYRPPYGRLEVSEPRQCVFAGTMNPIGGAGYLRDPTGGRRFWGLEVAVKKPIDIVGIKRDRAQLFAEALALFNAGQAWWPTAEFEQTHIVPEQDARQEEDVWDEKIEEYLAQPVCCGQCQPRCTPGEPPKNPMIRLRTTVGELAKFALFIGAGGLDQVVKIGRAEQNRITASLARLGWERGKRTGKGKWWVPTAKWSKRQQEVTAK
jgi:predicted P-loop ATPase